MKPRAVFNWSGGKDSALALYKVLKEQKYDVVALLTTVDRDTHHSTVHSIPPFLLQQQADSIGIPLYTIDIPEQWNKSDYYNAMGEAVSHFKSLGVSHFIFGDIFVHDVKSYREKQLKPYGITVVEPLWDKTTDEVMTEFLESGLKTIVVTTMADALDSSFVGRQIDRGFVEDLPAGMDICGENGEYHTFCYDGDIFQYPVSYSLGRPKKKSHLLKLADGNAKEFTYWFADINAI